MSVAQRQQLLVLLEQGAESHGFVGAVWTCARIAAVIQQQFRVRYHPSHVSRLLHSLHWTYQKPVLRASQRDEPKIVAWLTSTWPAIKKKQKEREEHSFLSTSQDSS
jgi:transposase